MATDVLQLTVKPLELRRALRTPALGRIWWGDFCNVVVAHALDLNRQAVILHVRAGLLASVPTAADVLLARHVRAAAPSSTVSPARPWMLKNRPRKFLAALGMHSRAEGRASPARSRPKTGLLAFAALRPQAAESELAATAASSFLRRRRPSTGTTRSHIKPSAM